MFYWTTAAHIPANCDEMPTPKTTKIFGKKKKDQTTYYYHQIFFHYVLQDGQRAHCAWDRAR